jgi:hypothetical protein
LIIQPRAARLIELIDPNLSEAWLMLTAIFLTILAVVFRMLSSSFQLWNFAPLGAVSLFAGSRLPRRWAWVVPVAAMAISDFLLDQDRYRPLFELSRWTIYATFAAVTLLGPLANRPKLGRWRLPVLALTGSTVFFLTSNLAVWGEGRFYPMTVSGLVSCYVAGIPFVAKTVAADLLGTALLFGLAPLFEQATQRWARPRLAEIRSEVHASDPSRQA